MSNQGGTFPLFEFGTRVIDMKSRYRDEEKRKYF
jgi:hypothetical protein